MYLATFTPALKCSNTTFDCVADFYVWWEQYQSKHGTYLWRRTQVHWAEVTFQLANQKRFCAKHESEYNA